MAGHTAVRVRRRGTTGTGRAPGHARLSPPRGCAADLGSPHGPATAARSARGRSDPVSSHTRQLRRTPSPPSPRRRATTPPRAASASPATAESRGSPSADWAGQQVVGTIDQYVGLVRDRTTRPALVATRGLVFGIIIAILAVAAVVLLWIAWITGITALVGEVWITYLITGGIFVLLGVFLMAKRGPAGSQA